MVTHTDRPSAVPELLDAYASMLRIRLAEEAILRLRLAGTIVGSVHLEMGQEAIPAGVVGARDARDPVFATYRGHGWALACGLPVKALFAEVAGRVGGPNDGRGGSAYFTAPEVGFMGENSIVGGGVPIAVGAALAARFDGSGRVAIAVFGDGATNQGAIMESLNLAAAKRLPVVFVCENNRYSELTRIVDMVGDPVLASARRGVRHARASRSTATTSSPCARWRARRSSGRARATGPRSSRRSPSGSRATTSAMPRHYREPGELDAAPRRRATRAHPAAPGGQGWDEAAIAALEAPVREEMERGRARMLVLPLRRPGHGRGAPLWLTPWRRPTATLTYAKAVNAALERALAAIPEAILYGEDMAVPGGVFGVTKGLRDGIRRARVRHADLRDGDARRRRRRGDARAAGRSSRSCGWTSASSPSTSW